MLHRCEVVIKIDLENPAELVALREILADETSRFLKRRNREPCFSYNTQPLPGVWPPKPPRKRKKAQ